jgi:hypothetical protein
MIENGKEWDATAYNMRFYKSGGVSTLKFLCKFSSASPAGSAVNPRLHKAAGR